MSETTKREGWCIRVRRDCLEEWKLAPLDRPEYDAVFRSEVDATRYAESAYGRNGGLYDWEVVPFAFFGDAEGG